MLSGRSGAVTYEEVQEESSAAPGGEDAGWRGLLERGIGPAVTGVVVVMSALLCTVPMRGSTPWMWFLEDDFYYYLKVAINLSHGAGSTFNGLVATNGYHPLWLLLLAGFCRITTQPLAVMGFLAAVSFVAMVATFALARAVLLRCGAGRSAAAVLAAAVLLYSETMLYGGMEVTLALPLMLAVMLAVLRVERWRDSPGWRVAFGLLVSAMILSRLDSALFAGLLLVSSIAALRGRWREMWAGAGTVLAGLLPVPVYVISQLAIFGVPMPVSGMAKQMKHGWWPTSPAVWSAFDRPWPEELALVVVLAGVGVLPWAWGRLRTAERAMVLAALLFPFAHVLLLSMRSDWQLWPWYLYGFRVAFLAALVVLFRALAPRFAMWAVPIELVCAAAVVAALCGSRRSTSGKDTELMAAVDLQRFAQTHPGVYAMGDRSGSVGYLLSDPVVQTEGLMMDRRFLDAIGQELPLEQVLARYGTRYYVGNAKGPMGACFRAVEPAQADRHSPHMRGTFCGPPLATFVHGGHYTVVYSMTQAVAGAR